jgi:tetratricopeptide (TPR) repeat protein
MAISEIEKLERRYAENPQGLTFAPLAEVHRKNGDTARALDLLRPGLELHPDYIPASIVLGRCHLDLGDLPAAETAFTHVLGLDSENVIALKALADINERLFRFDDAERWLRTLLSVDRSNDEARDQIERVEASRRQAEQASSADPDASLVDASLVTEPARESVTVADASPSEPSDAPAVTPPPFPVPAGEAWGMGPLDMEEMVSAPEASEPQAEGLELEQPVAMDEAVTPLEGLVGRDDTAEPGDEDLMSIADTDAFRVELSEEIILQSAGGGEFQVPNAAEELAGRGTAPRTDRPVTPPAAEPPAAEALAVEEPAAETPEPALSEAEPLTAAASYAEAAEPAVELAAAAAAESAEPPMPAPRQAYAAKDTHGQSVTEFFRGLLAARLPASSVSPTRKVDAATPAPAPEAEGAPTRPAHDSLSLSSVFGDEGTPTPPAVPASTSGASPAPADGSVSFDEFYSPAARGDAPRQARTPDTKSDDLDQFHTWLQNLKR